MSKPPYGAFKDHPPSTHSSNPYGSPPEMLHASRIPPLMTDAHVFFSGYEGDDPLVGLSQWYPSPFIAPVPGSSATHTAEATFPTTEHYMMYHKALLMGDDEIAIKILEAPHPSKAKALGRQVKGFDRERWTAQCDQIVEDGNWFKFSQHEDLRRVLLGTGDREIVESSPSDRIWGVGYDIESAMEHVEYWGNNGLGKALMRVRDRLKKEGGHKK